MPATPTILALRTITDWSQFAQCPTCDVLVEGSNAQGLVVRLDAVGSMGDLGTPSLTACERNVVLRIALDGSGLSSEVPSPSQNVTIGSPGPEGFVNVRRSAR